MHVGTQQFNTSERDLEYLARHGVRAKNENNAPKGPSFKFFFWLWSMGVQNREFGCAAGRPESGVQS